MADFLVIHIEEPTGNVIKVPIEPFYPKRSWPEKTPVWRKQLTLRSLCRTLDYVGIGYHLRDFEDIRAARGY